MKVSGVWPYQCWDVEIGTRNHDNQRVPEWRQRFPVA